MKKGIKTTILFDLGQTLMNYYERAEIPDVLRQCIISVQTFLQEKNLFMMSPEIMWQRVEEVNYEAEDYRVRPLEERLIHIFQLDKPSESKDLIMETCRHFMRPIFARGYCYEDTIPTLKRLKSMGFKSAIISNTPWGSPANLWREEIERYGLSKYVNVVVFCRDVGWRKPAHQIFEFALKKLQALPHNCIFVGDDPRWDIVGPRAVGIDALLVDRKGTQGYIGGESIKNLSDLVDKLETY